MTLELCLTTVTDDEARPWLDPLRSQLATPDGCGACGTSDYSYYCSYTPTSYYNVMHVTVNNKLFIVDCSMHSLHVVTGWSIRTVISYVDWPTKNHSTKIATTLHCMEIFGWKAGCFLPSLPREENHCMRMPKTSRKLNVYRVPSNMWIVNYRVKSSSH